MNRMTSETSETLLLQIKEVEETFLQFIRERLGIRVQNYQVKEFQKTIKNACEKFNLTPQQYLLKVSKQSNDSPLLEHLVAGVTVGETYFFRDKNQMQWLSGIILPKLIAMKRSQKDLSLRIWSAGCASGEEVYTICMLLLELLPDIKKWRLQILGTDINMGSLQKALCGVYSEWSMRAISLHMKQKYFRKEHNQYRIENEVRDLARFNYLNLNTDTYPALFNGTNAQDLILCRNVLIYFDSILIHPLMLKLNHSLIPGGCLLLGASDPIMIEKTDFIVHHEEVIYFTRATESQYSAPLARPPKKPSLISRLLVKRKAGTLLTPTQPIPIASETSIDKNKINLLLKKGLWQEAIEAIEHFELNDKKNKYLLNSKAQAYANLGELDKSLAACQESLKLDSTDRDTHFILALTLTELDRLEEAEKAFRKTLFLDRLFAIGHFQLGLLLLRKKQHEMGLKSLKNALTIAVSRKPTESVPGYQELNYGKLSEIFKHEIEIHVTERG